MFYSSSFLSKVFFNLAVPCLADYTLPNRRLSQGTPANNDLPVTCL